MDCQTTKPQPNAFTHPDSCRTLALEVEKTKFWIPRDTLANYSPVFKAMLYGHFDESSKDTVELPGKKADDIYELLLCLIPTPYMKNIDDSNLELMLAFSDEYNIEDLRRRAENYLKAKLMTSGKSQDKLFYILRVGSNWKMRTLLGECIKKCATEFSVQQLQPLFEDLWSEVIASLMVYSSMFPADAKCRYVTGLGLSGTRCHMHKRVFNMMCVYCGNYKCGTCLNDGFEKNPCSATMAKAEETVGMMLSRM